MLYYAGRMLCLRWPYALPALVVRSISDLPKFQLSGTLFSVSEILSLTHCFYLT